MSTAFTICRYHIAFAVFDAAFRDRVAQAAATGVSTAGGIGAAEGIE